MQKYLLYPLMAAALLALFSPNEILAGQIGPEASIEQANARLIVGPPNEDGMLRGAVELELADGFKTYWHVPGDGGLPPLLKMNGQPLDVRLPAPIRYNDAYGEALGYKAQVAIAFEVPAPKDGTLAVDMLVGVCADICIPFIATLEAPVPPTMMPRTRFALDDAHEALPTDFHEDLSVNAASLVSGVDGAVSLTTELSLPVDVDMGEVDVFARLPGKDEFFPRAATVTKNEGDATAVIEVTTDLTLDELAGREVVFTLVSGERSVEGVLALP